MSMLIRALVVRRRKSNCSLGAEYGSELAHLGVAMSGCTEAQGLKKIKSRGTEKKMSPMCGVVLASTFVRLS